MAAIEVTFWLWLAFGAWWLLRSIAVYKIKATGRQPHLARFVVGRLAVWLAAGLITLLVAVYISNTINAGMR
jgi:hypothetical protein